MRRYFSILLFPILLFSIPGVAQTGKSALLQNMDMQNVRPEDIPDPDQLKMMGASDEQIRILTDIKNKKGTVAPSSNQGAAIVAPVSAKLTADSIQIASKRHIDSLMQKSYYDSVFKFPPVTIYGQEFFRNRSLGAFDKTESSRAPDNYILSSGDRLVIAVWGYSDYNETFIIDKEGFIQPKDAGRVYLKGLTFSDARQLLERKFGSILDLKNSRIDITLTGSRTITVNIVGEVNSPGSYSMSATNTAFNALIMANGTNSIGSVRKIYIRRDGKTIKTLDVYNYLLNPNNKEDFFLENNDYILVPPADKVVSIRGEVKRPFGYEVLDKEGIADVIRYAGGIKSTGYNGSVLLKRIDKGRTYFQDINLDSLSLLKSNFSFLDGDSIIVKRIPDYPEGYVEVAGAVRVPGRYQHLDNERLSGLIKRAKGVMDETYLARAYLVRQRSDLSKEYIAFNLGAVLKDEGSSDNLVVLPYDVVQVFSKKRFSDPDSIYVLGSIRKPGRYLFGTGLKVKDAVFLAGGFNKEAANNRIEISRLSNIGKGSQDTSRVIVLSSQIAFDLSLDKNTSDFELQPFDQVFVRRMASFEYQENVILSGEVIYPGSYSLVNKNERLFDVIGRAGGLSQWAFPEGTKIFRKQDSIGYLFLNFSKEDLNNPSSEFNYILKSNDSIFIPRCNELVALGGAINYPGIDTIRQINAPFFMHTHARYYIRHYGVGFARGAQKRKTYVINPGGFIRKAVSLGLFKFYPRVEKGSKIIAVYKPSKKEKDKKASEPINWNKVIENATIKTTAMLTLYLLLKQVGKL